VLLEASKLVNSVGCVASAKSKAGPRFELSKEELSIIVIMNASEDRDGGFRVTIRYYVSLRDRVHSLEGYVF
jgi:hypothetical protein